MSDLVHGSPVVIERGPPELQERNTWVGARLLVSSTVFLFLPFVFAYLYLASLNTSKLWKPAGVKGPIGWGLAVLLTLVASAALLAWARAELARGRERGSRYLALAALLVGLAAVVLQGLEYANLGFGPADGGFASVFVGWSGLFAVTLLGALLWLEMVLAASFRNGSNAPGSSRSDLDAVGFYLAFLAGLGALTFTFLYLL